MDILEVAYHFRVISNKAMFVGLLTLYLMLSLPGALCAGDNPLSGQHLRVLALEVCAPFYIVSYYLPSVYFYFLICTGTLLTFTVSYGISNGKECYRACRSRLWCPGTYDGGIKSDAQL